MNPPTFVLASGSPRRQQLMESLGLAPFRIRPPEVDESLIAGEPPAEFVERLARLKACAIASPGEVVLGADTIVVLDEKILGKPQDIQEAKAMLRLLRNKKHRVYSGVALCRPGWQPSVVSGVDQTTVDFGDLSDREIEHYIATNEPMDKAGAYAIQGIGSTFIRGIKGNYHTVMGLPLPLVRDLGRKLGWDPLNWDESPAL